MSDSWKSIPLRKDAELLRKETYSYQVGSESYQIELFETMTDKFYAIGTPTTSDQLYIYGSAVVGTPELALEQAIKKINREHDQAEIQQIGEDVHDLSDET